MKIIHYLIIIILISVTVSLFFLTSDRDYKLEEKESSMNLFDGIGPQGEEPELNITPIFKESDVSITRNILCKNITSIGTIDVPDLTKAHANKTGYETKTIPNIQYNYRCRGIESYNISYKEKTFTVDMTSFGKCSMNSTCLICDSREDGNGDGKCHGGESCIKYCYGDAGLKQNTKIDAPSSIRKKIINEVKPKLSTLAVQI